MTIGTSSTVYGLCDRGELRHLKVSGAIRIYRDSLEDLVRGRRQ